MGQAPAWGLKVIYGYTVWQRVCARLPSIWPKNKTAERWFSFEVYQSYSQFTLTDQWLHCSYEHVLHSVNALLLCMSAAGFRQCALCLLLGNSFFTPLQRWILSAVPECKRKANIEFIFIHTLHSHSPPTTVTFKMTFHECFIEHISHELLVDLILLPKVCR